MSERGVQDWGKARRRLAWVHVTIQVVVVAALLVMLNLLARKFPSRIDLTSTRSYALSVMAEDLLRGLKYDVEIWVNGDPYGTSPDKCLPNALKRTGALLEEFRRRSDHVKVYLIQGQSIPRQDVFQKHWSIVPPNTMFILATLDGNRENKKQIELQDLYEGDGSTGTITLFRGEPYLVQAIRELGGNVKRIVYESEGHQEIVTADVRRMSTLTNFLRLNEGIEFRRLALADLRTVPVDCDLLVILAPSQPFLDAEIEVLRDYLERGGSLLVAMNPRTRTGIEKLLEEYSIKVGDNVVCDAQQYVPPKVTNLILAEFNVHPVNRNMVNMQFQMPYSCTVDPIDRRDPDWTITPLAMAGPGSWEEKGGLGPNDRPKADADERTGNMKVLVAVEKKAKHPMDEKHQTAKIVVWGSAIPFTNAILPSPYVFQQIQGQYIVNHFRWLMEKKLLDVGANTVAVKPLEMSGEALSQLRWVIHGGFPALGIGLGLLAWYLRRK